MDEPVIWVWSDPHFGHKNVIKFSNRPFADVETMDRALMDNLKRSVQPSHVSICLGDVAFKAKAETEALIRSLPGINILVRGNHDKSPATMMARGFTLCVESMVLKVGGFRVLLRHFPLYEPLPDGVHGVLHGHTHNATEEALARAGEGIVIPEYNLNCCVEKHNYRPIQLTYAVGLLKKRLRWKGDS